MLDRHGVFVTWLLHEAEAVVAYAGGDDAGATLAPATLATSFTCVSPSFTVWSHTRVKEAVTRVSAIIGERPGLQRVIVMPSINGSSRKVVRLTVAPGSV